ncbi:MAG: hypothetical protein ACE5FA_01070 [Dehalococcoidia bacterium]
MVVKTITLTFMFVMMMIGLVSIIRFFFGGEAPFWMFVVGGMPIGATTGFVASDWRR